MTGGREPDGPPPDERQALGAAGVAAGLGCSIVTTVMVCIFGGVLIDRETGRTPLFTLIGVALALFLAAYQLVELARVGRNGVRPGPVTRGLQTVTGPIAQRRGARADRKREVGEEQDRDYGS
ncbi:MAG: AtpZ/AtpI family protein [Thermomicrobiales bacterium]|nr:AtpZ/AtpI family protein [Thermomicrobiales bacterium]